MADSILPMLLGDDQPEEREATPPEGKPVDPTVFKVLGDLGVTTEEAYRIFARALGKQVDESDVPVGTAAAASTGPAAAAESASKADPPADKASDRGDKAKGSAGRVSVSKPGKFPRRCYYCHREGHVEKHCARKRTDQFYWREQGSTSSLSARSGSGSMASLSALTPRPTVTPVAVHLHIGGGMAPMQFGF